MAFTRPNCFQSMPESLLPQQTLTVINTLGFMSKSTARTLQLPKQPKTHLHYIAIYFHNLPRLDHLRQPASSLPRLTPDRIFPLIFFQIPVNSGLLHRRFIHSSLDNPRLISPSSRLVCVLKRRGMCCRTLTQSMRISGGPSHSIQRSRFDHESMRSVGPTPISQPCL